MELQSKIQPQSIDLASPGTSSDVRLGKKKFLRVIVE